MPKKTLNTYEASEYLREEHGIDVSPSTLMSKRSRGGGPNFERFLGKVFYRPPKLDVWVIEKTSTHTHTA